ncbi:MAG: hypothetical protein IPK67_20650 [Planctomycetes bacterium]|nr:hypothetical protein [Planctomycetota bacterium]
MLAYLTDEFSGFRVLDLREAFQHILAQGHVRSRQGARPHGPPAQRPDPTSTACPELRDPAKSEGGRNALSLSRRHE